jgi:hypothetical protein
MASRLDNTMQKGVQRFHGLRNSQKDAMPSTGMAARAFVTARRIVKVVCAFLIPTVSATLLRWRLPGASTGHRSQPRY